MCGLNEADIFQLRVCAGRCREWFVFVGPDPFEECCSGVLLVFCGLQHVLECFRGLGSVRCRTARRVWSMVFGCKNGELVDKCLQEGGPEAGRSGGGIDEV